LDYKEIKDADRPSLVRSLLETVALPFLQAAGSLGNIARYLAEGQLRSAAIVKSAKELLQQENMEPK
jgi:hypothetical protein